MKAIQVRKGNILECKGKIVELNDTGTAWHTHVDLERPYRSVSLKTRVKEYSPILMDEDWHDNFGVKMNGFLSFEYIIPWKQNINVIVVFRDNYIFLRQKNDENPLNDSVISMWNNDIMKRGIYVHEWQNLYNSLSGGEELKLVKKL